MLLTHNCETLPVVKFTPIVSETELPEIDPKILSKDQRYLLEMTKAVMSGNCPDDLAKRNPGTICHSRWLTTANHLLRAYISKKKRNKELTTLVKFIVKIYTPIWFSIRKEPECYNGAKHLFKTIQLSRSFDKSTRDTIDSVIQRNSYFGHSENLLLAMMVDDSVEIRTAALNKILECRKTSKPGTPVRKFQVPKLNFDAQTYTEMIDWTNMTEPPLTKNIPTEELAVLITVEYYKLKDMFKFPCHTQGVERTVKIVTEAARTVCGHEKRHAQILSKLESRSKMPKLLTFR